MVGRAVRDIWCLLVSHSPGNILSTTAGTWWNVNTPSALRQLFDGAAVNTVSLGMGVGERRAWEGWRG